MCERRKRSLRALAAVVFLCWLSSCAFKSSKRLSEEPYQEGYITDKRISEASGMVDSRINKDVIWVNNDSFSLPELYAINKSGNYLTKIKIKGVENIDWEDLAITEYQGRSYIVIADVGDNYSERDIYQLHFIAEPLLENPEQVMSVEPEWTVYFRYEDGSRDCEAVAVDPVEQKILLLSKREDKPRLYQLPVKAKGIVEAKLVGELPPFPDSNPNFFNVLSLAGYGAMPTGMDIAEDGKSAVVLTYTGAYLFDRRNSDESWLDTFSAEPRLLEVPNMQQAEAISFSSEGKSVYITSEKIPAPLAKVSLK